MKKVRWSFIVLLGLAAGVLLPKIGWAADLLNPVEDVQRCDRALHIMAMLLVGFGFLMVFVKKYGRSALTATFLMVSVAIPLYLCLNGSGWFGGSKPVVEGLILAEFAAAGLLICAGAVLGRLKMFQYILLGLLFVPCYMLNEWILLSGGLGLLANIPLCGGTHHDK